MSITIEQIIKTMRKHYKEIRIALDEAEQEYNSDKRSIKKRETYQFIAAQEMIVNDICNELGIELIADNMEVIEED